jgi:hypothetical protein
MPNLTKQRYKSENLSFEYDVYVDKQGNFTATLPKDVVEKLEGININLQWGRRGRKGWFSEKSLHELEKAIKETADKFSKKKLIDEKIIIRYAVDTRCSYCRSANGNIYPNGHWETQAEGEKNGYHWIESSLKQTAMDRGPFALEVAFEIKKRRTWQFPNKETTIEYERLEESELKKDGVMDWLYALCGIDFSHNNEKEIEYTDEIGLFFKNMILFIININERICQVFGGEFDLSKIEPLRLTDGNPLLR